MEQLIKILLHETGFENIQPVDAIEKQNCLFSENRSKNIFYISNFYDSINDFNEEFRENQNKAFNFICIKDNSNELKKNTSMIIFIKVEDATQISEMQSKILELEEDVYFFKKYVLLYLEEELEELKSAVERKKIYEFMKDNINNEELFEEFKVEEILSLYSLILKLYIKMPHLIYSNTFEPKDIQDLHEKITNDLEEKCVLNLHNELLNADDIDSWIDKEIDINKGI